MLPVGRNDLRREASSGRSDPGFDQLSGRALLSLAGIERRLGEDGNGRFLTGFGRFGGILLGVVSHYFVQQSMR